MPTLFGLAGKETRAAERRLASLIASKLHREYSEMAFFVFICMNLAIVRANTLLLHGSKKEGI